MKQNDDQIIQEEMKTLEEELGFSVDDILFDCGKPMMRKFFEKSKRLVQAHRNQSRRKAEAMLSGQFGGASQKNYYGIRFAYEALEGARNHYESLHYVTKRHLGEERVHELFNAYHDAYDAILNEYKEREIEISTFDGHFVGMGRNMAILQKADEAEERKEEICATYDNARPYAKGEPSDDEHVCHSIIGLYQGAIFYLTARCSANYVEAFLLPRPVLNSLKGLIGELEQVLMDLLEKFFCRRLDPSGGL